MVDIVPPARAIVAAQSLTKRYGDYVAVDGIDLDIRPNECFGLLGPNGAGKTTTLRMLIGMTFPDDGSLEVMGYPVPEQAQMMRQRLGVVPQTDMLDPDFSAAENLRIFASYFGIQGAALEERVEELLQFASLQERGDTGIQELSGGMKRRLTLARALVNDPELVILDEPTTGLDPQVRQVIWQRLRSLLKQGRTLILTTHYMDEAQRLCDRLAIMDQGRILDIGSPKALIARHIEPHVTEIYGDGRELWLEERGKAHTARVESVGETLFCYCHDEAPLLNALANQSELQFLHRPANLEDVFLKLTGRDLRE